MAYKSVAYKEKRIVLRVRDRHVFYNQWKFWTISIIWSKFSKDEIFLKELEYHFLVESTKIANATFPYKATLPEANAKTNRLESTKGTYHEEWKNKIWRTTSSIQTNGDHYEFFIRIPILYLFIRIPRSGPFCWQKPCSGCNSGIDLVAVFSFNFFLRLPAVVLTNNCQS